MELLSHLGKILSFAMVIFFGGCSEENICNMTPNVMPQNQSNLYTITMAIRGINDNIVEKSIKPYVVINGEKRVMEKHPDDNNIFVYDCRLSDVGTIPYYFELVYAINRNGYVREKVAKSELYYTIITNQHAFLIDNRAPVGARMNVVGHGLNEKDKIRIGERIVPMNILSSEAAEFIVPSIECNKEYEIYLVSGRKELFVGLFFVDSSYLYCSSDSVHLNNGDSQCIIFMIDNPHPDGIDFDVKTDIPESIIMNSKIHFNPGERTVNVNIKGSDKSDEGTLYVKANGYELLTLEVKVGSDNDRGDDGESDEEVKNDQNVGKFLPNSRPLQPISLKNMDDNDVVVL